MNKSISNFIENHKHNLFSNSLIFLGLAFWLFLLGYRNFARGFDFTDATLNYHFSLRILNREIPFKDFHFSVMPLSFYIEAFFHKLFGFKIVK